MVQQSSLPADPASASRAEPDPVALLCPRPQRTSLGSGSLVLPARVLIAVPRTERASAGLEWLGQALLARGHQPREVAAQDPSASIVLRIAAEHPPEHYMLRIGAGTIEIHAGAAHGLQHGLATLAQLVALSSSAPGRLALPCLTLEDWPDLAARGVMLDVSRDRVPTLATTRLLIDRVARWKMNQLQLYMEHTFAYAGHERVWRDASPFTASEIRELDAYARGRHVELVPNQNSFGHMERWLVHEPYRALAECPEGFEHPANWTGEPYGLCPLDPGSLALLEDLYDQLGACFSSRQLNVGLDETIDLGRGRSKAACEERGTGRVYLEFLQAVHARVEARGRRMQFWGDIIVQHPELIAELPKSALALEWGYEADHPWAEHLARFREAGLEFYVCPGTSSWCSIAGRSDNALANLAGAATHGKAAGASGMLITDWGDHGYLQPLAVSYLGLLAGAAFAWNVADASRTSDEVTRWLDAHAFCDSAGVLGKVARDLGNAYRETGSLRPNSSVLFWSLIKPERVFAPEGVTRESLERTLEYVERVSEPLADARPAPPEGPLLKAELAWVRDTLRFACRLGIARAIADGDREIESVPRATRLALARELAELIERQRELWRERSRPGGLADSTRRLERLLETLRA